MKLLAIATGLFLAISALLVAWWLRGPDPVIHLTGEPVELERYSDGTPSKSVSLPPDSELSRKIEAMLVDRRGKWTRSLYSYAPGILLRGETFSINLKPTAVILNFHNRTGNTDQVVSDLANEEFTEIEKLVVHFMNRNGHKD
jgi:hypothetical protein